VAHRWGSIREVSDTPADEPLRLDELVDVGAIQALMDDFHALTGLPIGLLDLDSNVLVGTGWQDACTKFHRANAQSMQACLASDRAMSRGVPAGEFKAYKCAHGMWDVVTPLYVGDEHVGNIFVGQFFYDDETVDTDFFRAQAERYGFDAEAYVAAVEAVPRFSHETVDRLMRFYTRLAGQLASMGDANRELRQMARALARASAADSSFRLLIEQAPLGVAMTRNNEVIYANPTFAAMYGFADPDELVGLGPADLVAPSDRAAFIARATARAQGLPVERVYEVHGRRRDGTEFPVMASAMQIELPDGPAVLGMFQDLSALRTTEEALRQSEEKFAMAFQTSPDAVTVNRLSDGLYLAVNEGFCNLLGYTSDEAMGKTSLDLDIWAIREDREQLVAGLREHGRYDNLESQFRGRDGILHTALMSARIMEFDGEPAILAVTRDITARKVAENEILGLNQELLALNQELSALNRELEDRVADRTSQLAALNEELIASNEVLAQMNVELDAATRAKNEFLASMSHELRTPLNSILGFSGTLLQGLAGPLEDEQLRQVTMINNSGRHLLELINGVLDLAKIEAGQTDLTIEAVDPCVVLAEALEFVRPLAEGKGLGIETDCPPAHVGILTDRTRLRQILINLLGNAVKFTDAGHIAVRARLYDDVVDLEVEDTGRGIGPDDAPHVFDQFYQGRPEDGGKTAGTGLGLSVSRSLAAMLGGTITMCSTPGEGTIFTLRLPRSGPHRG